MELKQEIYSRVKYLRFVTRKSVMNIQEKLLKVFNKDVSIGLIREIIHEINDARKKAFKEWEKIESAQETLIDSKNAEKADWWLKKLVEAWGDNLPYRVTDDYYIFHKDYKDYPVLISTVRAIYECYSRFGKDMTWEDVRQLFKLTPVIRELIKNQTWLYKSSHIDDPVTLSRLGEDELEEHIDGKVSRVIEDKYIDKYHRAVRNKRESDLKKFALSNKWYDLFLSKLEKVIALYKPRDFNGVKIPNIPNNKTKDVFITDAHFGKKWTDGIFERFKKLTRDLTKCSEKNINITFGGDLWECFVPYGEMHPGQKIWMENINTEDLVMMIVDVFEQMLVTLYKSGKIVTFYGMGGNHDRFTEKWEFDPYRTPAMIVYRFLHKIVKGTTIKINILRDRANIIKNWKIKYVFLHGDWLSESEVKRRAINEIEDGFYLCIVTWDKHYFRINEISDRVLWIQSPAMAWPWKYDTELWLSSLPGHIEFINNADWMVDIFVKRYK